METFPRILFINFQLTESNNPNTVSFRKHYIYSFTIIMAIFRQFRRPCIAFVQVLYMTKLSVVTSMVVHKPILRCRYGKYFIVRIWNNVEIWRRWSVAKVLFANFVGVVKTLASIAKRRLEIAWTFDATKRLKKYYHIYWWFIMFTYIMKILVKQRFLVTWIR